MPDDNERPARPHPVRRTPATPRKATLPYLMAAAEEEEEAVVIVGLEPEASPSPEPTSTKERTQSGRYALIFGGSRKSESRSTG
ncbi:MAG: hypothetical protein R3B72_24185 [Polyangiaceae bacterium]